LHNMGKNRRYAYVFLTLFKEDFRELVQLFQDNLQDVDIRIDDLYSIDLAQLEKFKPDYRAKFFVVRGYGPLLREAEIGHQGERLIVELKITNTAALLVVWNKVGRAEPEVLVRIKKLLARRVNSVYAILTQLSYHLTGSLPVTIAVAIFHQYTDVISRVQYLFIAGISILLLLVFFVISIRLRRFYKVDRSVFLFPGAVRTTRVYGRREMLGSLLINLIVFVAIQGCFIFALRNLEAA
jgi:hypothetical protein